MFFARKEAYLFLIVIVISIVTRAALFRVLRQFNFFNPLIAFPRFGRKSNENKSKMKTHRIFSPNIKLVKPGKQVKRSLGGQMHVLRTLENCGVITDTKKFNFNRL